MIFLVVRFQLSKVRGAAP